MDVGRLDQAARAAQHKGNRKKRVDAQIERDDDRKKLAPGHGEQGLVGTKRSPERKALASYVEAAIAVEQALAALARDHRSEAEVAKFILGARARQGGNAHVPNCKLLQAVTASRRGRIGFQGAI